MQADRYSVLPDSLTALTATAHGMVGHSFARAAGQAFDELISAVSRAGLTGRIKRCIALLPDVPEGPDDPESRYVAGAVFGYDLANGSGQCVRPSLALSGTLAWVPIAAGRYAVFKHIGPYTGLHLAWEAVYRDWLPRSGVGLRDSPPMEVCINDPSETPPEKLHTEIWLPIEPA